MPEREEVLIRASAISECPENTTIWTGKLHGSYFEMHKPDSVLFERGKPFLILDLRGKKEGKQELRDQFIAALGQPLYEMRSKRFKSPQCLLWDSTKALQHAQQIK